MKPFLRLITPDVAEAVAYASIGLALLLVQNIQRFWVYLDGNVVSVASDSGGIDTGISEWLLHLESQIDPRIVDFMAWVLVGSVVYIVISYMIAGLKSASDEVGVIHYYRSPKGRVHELNAFLAKLSVRIAAVIGLVGWFFVFLQYINPIFSKLFFTAVLTPLDPVSWLWFVLTVGLYAASLYAFSVFARLIMLRPRVFGEIEELGV